jgi:hypothetical protein
MMVSRAGVSAWPHGFQDGEVVTRNAVNAQPHQMVEGRPLSR